LHEQETPETDSGKKCSNALHSRKKFCIVMKQNRYIEMDFRDIRFPLPMDRRDFLRSIGTGLVIAFTIKPYVAEVLTPQRQETDLNAYLKISGDNRVTLFTGKIEMGQGVITSLALMLADELDVTPDQIDLVMGDTELCPWDMGTFGSMTTRFFGPPLRAAGAKARKILRRMAAEKLEVPEDDLMAKAGTVYVKKNPERLVTYGELTRGKAIVANPDPKPDLKKPAEFKYMGTPVKRRDSVEKVTGSAKYAGDIHLPGMLFARILRPPSHAATLIRADTSVAEKIAGVQVVRLDDEFIAVLHQSLEDANRAIEKVDADWEFNDLNVNEERIFDYLEKSTTTSSEVVAGGSLETGKSVSSRLLEKTYTDGYKAHATIENHTATATVEEGRLKIWASTQTPFRLQS